MADSPASQVQPPPTEEELRAVEALFVESNEPLVGTLDDAFIHDDEIDEVLVPTGRHRDGQQVAIVVKVRDPGVSSQAVALELADPKEKELATLRLWRACVVEPREIARSYVHEEAKDADVRAWEAAEAAWQKAAEDKRGPRPKRPFCFEDTTTAFRGFLTIELQLKLGIDADFTQRLLRKTVSKEAVHRAIKSYTKSLPPTGSIRRKLHDERESARAGSPTPTSGSASVTDESAPNGSSTPPTPSPAASAGSSNTPNS
jgi:hypothetical protein